MTKNPTFKHDLNISQDPYYHMIRMVFTRWKPFLLHAFTFEPSETIYFSHFLKQLPVSPKVLSENLKELEADGLIAREIVPANPPRTCYRLMPKGRQLIPILDAVYQFGRQDMLERGLDVDELGEMWHGYRHRNESLMHYPYLPIDKPEPD